MRIISALRTRCFLARSILASALLSAAAAKACDVIVSPQPANIERAAAIFRGEIVSYRRLAERSAELEFSVTQTIKGETRERWQLVWAPNAPIDPRNVDDFRRTYGRDVVVGVSLERAETPVGLPDANIPSPGSIPRVLHADCEDPFFLRWDDEHEPILIELKSRKVIPGD